MEASKLYVKPIAWSSVNPGPDAIKSNPSLQASIQLFGYTSDGRTIYVRIPKKSTFIIKFNQPVDEEIASNINDILIPSIIKPSYINNNIVVVRAPEITPMELTANPDYEGLATWEDVKQDPYGELESLWEYRKIGPYEWISINRYSPIPGKYTKCDINIKTEEDNIFHARNIQLPVIFPKLFFWDIETYSSKTDQFPSSTNPDDFISLISIITVSRKETNGYVIIKGNVNSDDIVDKHENLVVIKVDSEKNLLKTFFAIYNTFDPDRQIYFNGDMFDMPYFINRLAINNEVIPRISKIISLNPWTINKSFPTPFGRETERTINIPGTEIIDIIHFYRRFYPHFKNHKLDTIAKTLLGQGKTGLTIEEMMNAIKTNDPNKLADVVDYSYIDSLRMHELWMISDIQDTLEHVCNNLGISIDNLLRLSFESIIDRAAYNIDPGCCIIKGKYGLPTHLKDAVPGIYRNVYVYDYSELYRMLMISSDQPIASVLGNNLDSAPSKLIQTAFYSVYVDRTELLPMLDAMLNSVLESNSIIALEPFTIRSVGPLNAKWLKLVEKSNCYVSVSKASYIIINDSGDLETAGLSKLCRPKFSFAEDIIKQYFSLIYANKLNEFEIPNMKEAELDKFIISERIGDISSSPTDSVKYKLALQYPEAIDTWISVKYVMTLRGPILLSKLSDDDIIDYHYYTSELNKYMKDLQSLKLYGA